jgi:MtN3 and saliva related transmembrane protein
VPQAWRAWKTRSVRDLSLWMYLLIVTGIVLWLIYGALIHSWPLVLANTVSLSFTSFILMIRLLWR